MILVHKSENTMKARRIGPWIESPHVMARTSGEGGGDIPEEAIFSLSGMVSSTI